jgi:hypothetical protein
MTEIWRDIDERLYEVSSLGQVRNKKTKRLVKPCDNGQGYMVVDLRQINKGVQRIHRLVALAFLPNFKNLPEVDHKDRNKANNKLWNLKWSDDFGNNQNKERVINAQHIYERPNGRYYVKITRNGKTRQKYFNDYEAAAAWREQVLAQFSSVNV